MEAQQTLPKVRKLTVRNKGVRRTDINLTPGYIFLPVIDGWKKWASVAAYYRCDLRKAQADDHYFPKSKDLRYNRGLIFGIAMTLSLL